MVFQGRKTTQPAEPPPRGKVLWGPIEPHIPGHNICNLEEKRNNSSTKWLGPTESHRNPWNRDGLEQETAHTLKKMIYKL